MPKSKSLARSRSAADFEAYAQSGYGMDRDEDATFEREGPGRGARVWKGIKSGASTVGGGIVDGARFVKGGIANGATHAAGKVAEGARFVGGGIVDGATHAAGKVAEGASVVGDGILSGASAAGSAIAAAPGAIKDGIVAAPGAIKDGAVAAAAAANKNEQGLLRGQVPALVSGMASGVGTGLTMGSTLNKGMLSAAETVSSINVPSMSGPLNGLATSAGHARDGYVDTIRGARLGNALESGTAAQGAAVGALGGLSAGLSGITEAANLRHAVRNKDAGAGVQAGMGLTRAGLNMAKSITVARQAADVTDSSQTFGNIVRAAPSSAVTNLSAAGDFAQAAQLGVKAARSAHAAHGLRAGGEIGTDIQKGVNQARLGVIAKNGKDVRTALDHARSRDTYKDARSKAGLGTKFLSMFGKGDLAESKKTYKADKAAYKNMVGRIDGDYEKTRKRAGRVLGPRNAAAEAAADSYRDKKKGANFLERGFARIDVAGVSELGKLKNDRDTALEGTSAGDKDMIRRTAKAHVGNHTARAAARQNERAGVATAADALDNGKYKDLHVAKGADRLRKQMRGHHKTEASFAAVEGAGAALAGAGTLTAAADGGATKIAGNALRYGTKAVKTVRDLNITNNQRQAVAAYIKENKLGGSRNALSGMTNLGGDSEMVRQHMAGRNDINSEQRDGVMRKTQNMAGYSNWRAEDLGARAGKDGALAKGIGAMASHADRTLQVGNSNAAARDALRADGKTVDLASTNALAAKMRAEKLDKKVTARATKVTNRTESAANERIEAQFAQEREATETRAAAEKEAADPGLWSKFSGLFSSSKPAAQTPATENPVWKDRNAAKSNKYTKAGRVLGLS